MGLSSCKHDHARHCDGPGCRADPRKAPSRLCRSGYASGLISLCITVFFAVTAQAETLRVATYNTELSRKGPGLLLGDIRKGDDPQINAVIAQIAHADADIIALQGIDYDLEQRALLALVQSLAEAGTTYPYYYSGPPNAGRMTDLDLDGDGKLGGPGDAQGFGRFFGQGSMAVLSKHPILTETLQDHAPFLWRDLPQAMLPTADDQPFPSAAAQAIQRLSSHGHWVIPIAHPTLGEVQVLTYHATPPVFDGPEDRNGKRNHDETLFWTHLMEGHLGRAPKGRFVIMGDANLDPDRGDGRGTAMQTLLAHPKLQDPLPNTPTVSFEQTGPLRVDYVLPSADWSISQAQVEPADPQASRHSLVWIDLKR